MKIAITGAGPAGLLLAQNLITRPDYQVTLFEKHSDPTASSSLLASSSYPIGLQGRGMAALREVPDLESSILENAASGKWLDTISLHQGKSKPRKMVRPPANFWIERNDLAKAMLQHLRESSKTCCHASSSLRLEFDCAVQNVFLHNKTLITTSSAGPARSVAFDRVVIADGAKSVLRQCLAQNEKDFSYEEGQIPGGYRTLFLQYATDASEDDDELDRESIHGWMAGTHQVLSVPVKKEHSSGAFVFTEDTDPFADLKTPDQVLDLLESNLPQVAKLVTSQEAAALLQRPTRTTATVKCNRLTLGRDNEAVLIGDAAHTFSAAFNQGCNAALQDVQILNRLLIQNKDDWTKALAAYNAERLADAHAGHELANYSLPKSKLMKIEFLGRMILRQMLPSFLSDKMKPLPMDVNQNEKLSYREMLEKTEWWTERVKQSMAKSS